MERVKRILSYILVLSMCFTLFSFIPVHADNQTYSLFSGCGIFGQDAARRNIQLSVNSEVRAVIFDQGLGGYVIGFASLSSFNYSNTTGGSCPADVQPFSASSTNYNGNTIFYVRYSTNIALNFNDNGIPVISGEGNLNEILYYTFGDGAIGPEPPGPTYGRVADVEYATRIAGSGLASGDNIDRIVWNQSIDTNGNDLPTGAKVQIRAVPGKYVGNTANDVLNKTYTDFVLDHSKQLIIVDIIASRGVYETKWSEVVDHFGFFPYSWVPNIQYLDNEYFKMGWIYQIRLQVDDYYSDWQNIYTATGSGAAESQTITDSDELSQQLVQDINIVNQLNNTTTNWYINETTINNSEYTENSNGKPWWAYLLEAILSLFQIDDGNQQTINNTNNLNIDLNDKLNEYNEIEDQQLQNLDTNLEAIEVESDMLENNKFVGSANWVAQQYTRMTNGTVIGSLIGFSLLFGLALIFIGKIR